MELNGAYEEVRARVLRLAPGETLRVPRETLAPRPAAWRRSLGLRAQGASPFVQWRDGVVHVHATRTHYLLHRDTVDAHREPWRHLVEDAPRVARALRRAAWIGIAVAAAGAFLAIAAMRRA